MDECGNCAASEWFKQLFACALLAALQLAVADGLDIAVNMHVDDATGGGLGGWRNTLNFDPRQVCPEPPWPGLVSFIAPLTCKTAYDSWSTAITQAEILWRAPRWPSSHALS